jgi:hypothetical protein
VHSAAEHFTSHGNVRNCAEPKPFSRAKPAYVRISSSIFTVQDHILSTAGDSRSDVIDVLGVGDDVVDHLSSKDTVVI